MNKYFKATDKYKIFKKTRNKRFVFLDKKMRFVFKSRIWVKIDNKLVKTVSLYSIVCLLYYSNKIYVALRRWFMRSMDGKMTMVAKY